MIRSVALVFALLAQMAPVLAEPISVSGIPFPDGVGSFSRGSVQDYEKTHPGLGQSIAYAAGPLRANIYVYDLRRSSIPDSPESEIITTQFEQAKGDIYRARQQGAWQKVELKRSFNLPESGPPRFICALFTLVNKQDITLDSTLCVAGARNKFVKFRVTGPPGDPEPPSFIEAFAALLWPGA
jgi:hypothetical protein